MKIKFGFILLWGVGERASRTGLEGIHKSWECWDGQRKTEGTHKVVKQREETQMASLQGSRVKILRSLTFFFFWNMKRLGAGDQHIFVFQRSIGFCLNYSITTRVWTNHLCCSRPWPLDWTLVNNWPDAPIMDQNQPDPCKFALLHVYIRILTNSLIGNALSGFF